jgi:methionyl-tRNA synthetase
LRRFHPQGQRRRAGRQQCRAELTEAFLAAAPGIADAYEARDFARAMREIMALADRANAWIADKAPWSLNKQEGKQDEVQAICATGINLFRQLVIFLKPVLPLLAADAEAFLNVAPLTWNDHTTPAGQPSAERVQAVDDPHRPGQSEAMTDASKEDLPPARPTPARRTAGNGELAKDPLSPEIDFDTFAAVDLRVALIVKAEPWKVPTSCCA